MIESCDPIIVIGKIINDAGKPIWYSDLLELTSYDLETIVDSCDKLVECGLIKFVMEDE